MAEPRDNMEQLTFDAKRIKVVDIDEVRPNTWNPKEQMTEEFEEVKRSLEINGQDLPIQVRSNDGYEIIDGEQKWRAAKELDWKRVVIYDKGEITDQEARERTIAFQVQVPFSQSKLVELVGNLSKTYGNTNLPYSDEKLQEMLELADFDFDDIIKEPVDVDVSQLANVVIRVTNDQYKVITKAVSKIQDESNETEVSEGRALELICADFTS